MECFVGRDKELAELKKQLGAAPAPDKSLDVDPEQQTDQGEDEPRTGDEDDRPSSDPTDIKKTL